MIGTWAPRHLDRIEQRARDGITDQGCSKRTLTYVIRSNTSAAVTTMRLGVFAAYEACQGAAKESKVEYEFGDQNREKL
jgi:hypothetical protein